MMFCNVLLSTVTSQGLYDNTSIARRVLGQDQGSCFEVVVGVVVVVAADTEEGMVDSDQEEETQDSTLHLGVVESVMGMKK